MGEVDRVRERIREYFEYRYRGLECGMPVSFDAFCLGKDMETEEKKYLSRLERAKETGLCYHDWELGLEFIKTIIRCGQVRVRVREGHRVVFRISRDTVSSMNGLIHDLTLKKSNNEWYITSHRYRDEETEAFKYRRPLVRGPGCCRFFEQGCGVPVLQLGQYDRRAAVKYAHLWALDRNPKYYDFENLGGDCTNFCSQVLHAGGCPMNSTKTNGWYYYSLTNRSPSWTGVEFFHRFVTGNRGIGPRGEEASPSQIELGDIIQLDFPHNDAFNHCLVVVANPQPGDISRILISCHTVDRDNYPLVFYNWRGIRYIHISGCGLTQSHYGL